MRTIAVLNQKGGVGKTTTVTNIAAALAEMGSKVLAIDLDPQAHLTIHFGLEPQNIEAGAYKVLTQSAEVARQAVQSRENLWLLPANINLVGAETELVSVVGREIILREALEKVADRFDYCFIDCPPSLGLLTLNALAAAQEVLIPLQPHFLALQGVGKLLQTVELVNKRINPDLRVEGILLCMFDTRASLPSEVRADIEEFLHNARGTNCAWADARILPTFIRRNIKLAEAPSYGKTIFEYEQNCHGAEDYKEVAEYIRKGSRSHAENRVQTHKPAHIPIREAPKAPAPVAMTRRPAPPNAPEPAPTTPTENSTNAPEQQPSVPQSANQNVNPAPMPLARPDNEPSPADRPPVPVQSRPAPEQKTQPTPPPRPKLTSNYQYRPPAPPAPRAPQPPKQPANLNGSGPVAENRSPSQPPLQAQSRSQPQADRPSGPVFQGPVKKISAAGDPQPTTLQPRPKLTNTYQYRAPAPADAHKPLPPGTVTPQPQPKPPTNDANRPQAGAPIQNTPPAPKNPQTPPQPSPQVNINGAARPHPPIPPAPMAPQPPKTALKPTPQPATGDGVNSRAPLEIKQVPQNAPQNPRQPNLNNGQVRAARIIEITHPSQPTTGAGKESENPAEPTQGG